MMYSGVDLSSSTALGTFHSLHPPALCLLLGWDKSPILDLSSSILSFLFLSFMCPGCVICLADFLNFASQPFYYVLHLFDVCVRWFSQMSADPWHLLILKTGTPKGYLEDYLGGQPWQLWVIWKLEGRKGLDAQ